MRRAHSIFDHCSRGDLSFLICLPFILSQQTGYRNFRLDAKFLFEHPKLLLPDIRLTVRSFFQAVIKAFELIYILVRLFILLLLNVTRQDNNLPWYKKKKKRI